MAKYVFSTLTAPHKYPIYIKIEGRDLQTMASYVLIHGDANLPSKVLVTSQGAMTKVTDEQYAQLQRCPAFGRHEDRGFITVEDAPHDLSEVVENMEEKDTSAPMAPEDFENAGIKPPQTDIPSEEEADNSTVRSTQRPAQKSKKTRKPRKPRGEKAAS